MRQTQEKFSARACWGYTAVAAVFVLVYFANLHTAGLADWAPRFPLYICVNASAAVAIIVGIRRWRPHPSLPWWLMAVGQAVYTAGDFLFYWARYISHVNQYPGLADVFYLGRIPFMVAGLALIIRRRSGRDRAAVIDCLIVGVAAGVLSWVFLIEPYTRGSLGLAARVTSLAYPITDLMLAALAVRLLAGVGRRGASFYLLTGGLILLAVTDSVDGLLNLHGVALGSPSLVEGGWLLYYVTVGACGLHPSMRGLAAPIPRERVGHSRMRLAVLGAAALACPVLLVAESTLGQAIHAFPIALGSIAAFVLVLLRLADVMHHQQAAEVQVRYQAFHDDLTGLANRSLFYDRLAHAIDLSRREIRGLAVLLIDLDQFKPINDSLGHAAGDELLVAVARRISSCLRANDTAARLGGDEFVVLAEGVTTVDDAREVAERIIGVLAEPFVMAGAKMSVQASIGVAFTPTGAGSADELLNNADAAMYAAKRAAAGTYRVFEPSMLAAMNTFDRIDLDAQIRLAVLDGEFVVHYQPISSVETGTIAGVEALVRWEHPTRGLLPPSDFIPAADASGAIVDIGTFVLREACQQMKAWHDTYSDVPLRMNVNLSARELAEPDLVARVAQVLEETGLEPRFLTLELTETALMVDPVQATAKLRTLNALGVGLALDDFGTGFSSLSHLRRLPVDTLKIDKSFVDDVAEDADGFDFVHAIVRLARTMHLTTVAEGVEQPGQLRNLRRTGCDLMQGNLLTRPLPAAEIETMLYGTSPRQPIQVALTPGR